MPDNKIKQNGFTIVELMVAIALGMVVMLMISLAFNQASTTSYHATGLVEAHHRARVVFDMMKRDMQSMHPCGKLYIQPTGTEKIITFLSCVPSADIDRDRTTGTAFGEGEEYASDIVCVSYKFTTISDVNVLQRAAAEPVSGGKAFVPPNLAIFNATDYKTVLKEVDDVKFLFAEDDGTKTSSNTTYNEASVIGTAPTSAWPSKMRITAKLSGKTLRGGKKVQVQFTQTIALPVR